MKLAAACPVWQEARYLPLVLEQMSLVPGPKYLLWQDQPLFWFGEGEAPSGHASNVKAIVEHFPEITVVKMDHAPTTSDDPYGGFRGLAQLGLDLARKESADVLLWFDTDWLLTLDDVERLCDLITESTDRGQIWAIHARHYWRSFDQLMADGDITFGFPTTFADLWNYKAEQVRHTQYMSYHPAYVLSDDEMYRKVKSWGHAPIFEDRQFYEKEWIGRDDSLVKPFLADIKPPDEIMKRLRKWGALL